MQPFDRSISNLSRGQSPQRFQTRRLPARYARRRGVAFVYTALGLAVALMVAAIVIDVGLLYQRKASMQRAADSAALAGAYSLANFGSPYQAYVAAGKMAERPENGGFTKVNSLPGSFTSSYVANVGNSKFIVTYPATDEQGIQHNNWFKVTLSKPEPSLFGGMWPLNRKEYGVTASAIALYETLAPLEIKGTGTYGVAPGPVNLSVFGPEGRYSYGDPYSTKRLNDGSTNVRYNPNGYDFRVNIPTTIKDALVEIFDPDCYNANGSANASADAIDELRTPQTATKNSTEGKPVDATTTEYTLYYDNGTADTRDDVRIGNPISWGGDPNSARDKATDMQWAEAFKFNRDDYGDGNFRLNIRSTAGSSENGFDLRAGPERKEITTYTTERYISGYYYPQYFGTRYPYYSERQVPTTTPAPFWDPNNGTSIQAEGHLPINFNINGVTKMALGKVPPEAGGGELIITKFDTDINSQNITYTCDKLPGKSWPGTLTTDGTFTTDTIKIPDSYRQLAEAGTWYAEYVAGNQDTSVWDMSYTGNGPGRPGKIKLIR